MISYFCEILGVSRSRYYRYISTEDVRNKRESKDVEIRNIILKAFNKRGYKKGSRSIKMLLEQEENIIFIYKGGYEKDRQRQIHIEKTTDAVNPGEKIENVLVVWCAKIPGKKIQQLLDGIRMLLFIGLLTHYHLTRILTESYLSLVIGIVGIRH